MIEVRDVVKAYRVRRSGHGWAGAVLGARYERVEVIRHVDLEVAAGETLGLVGPNGAGKTTLIRMLAGVLQPTAGTVRIGGESPRRQRRRIGLVAGGTLVYHRLTGYDNLELYARLYGVQGVDTRIRELADFLAIGPHLDELVEHYSEGLRARLCLARALIHDPEVLILDEPTAAVDLFVSDEIHGLLRRLGKTMVLATHDLDEARQMADRIALIDGGRVTRIIDDPRRHDLREVLIHEARTDPRDREE